jgi:MFS family permease
VHAPPSPEVGPPSGEASLRQRAPNVSSGFWGKVSRVPTFSALQFREYRLLWLGQVGNSMGQWMDRVARGWLMYDLTGSAAQLGFVTAVQALPVLFLSPLAGALADRSNRKIQLIAAQLINGAMNAILATLIVTGHIALWHIYVTGLVNGIVQVFQQPARQSMVPEAVGRENLTNAIGLNTMVFNGARSLGPAIAGLLIGLVGPAGSYFTQAAMYLVASFWTFQIRLPGRAPGAATKSGRQSGVLQSTKEGWRYIFGHETIRAGIIVSFLPALLGMPFSALLPVFAKDVLQAGPEGQGLLLTAMGIGALIGAFLIASFGDRLPKGNLMMAGVICYGLGELGFALSHWFGVSLGFMVLLGLCNVSSNALVQTVVQAEAAPEMRGRVMGAFQQNQVLITVGSMTVGALADVFGAQPAVTMMGMACILSALVVYVAIPHIRTIR